jgi:hypothetical protein
MTVDYEQPSGVVKDFSHMDSGRVESMLVSIQQQEPELLQLLGENERTDEFILSSLIARTKNPELKASLLGTFIDGEVEEGDYFGAVFALAMTNAGNLGIKRFDEGFVKGQYDEALKSGQVRQAWAITLLMESEDLRERIVPEVRKDWNLKENKTFAELHNNKETNLEEVMDHVAGNLTALGQTLAVALVQGESLTHPYYIEAGRQLDDAINTLLYNMGYQRDINKPVGKRLTKIEEIARRQD